MTQDFTIEYGGIYWINCDPSFGHEFQGKRPGVVIQSEEQITKSSLVTIMLITSNVERKLKDDILVNFSETNNLRVDSVLKVYDIHSFDKRRLLKRIGSLEDALLEQIRDYLHTHFRLDRSERDSSTVGRNGKK